MDLGRVVTNPRLAESFDIIRRRGKWVEGNWQYTEEKYPTFGAVTVAQPEDVQMVPEGDRIGGMRSFYTTQQLFVTNAEEGVTSDVLVWRTVRYRILSVFNYSNRGYWKAVAARMTGD